MREKSLRVAVLEDVPLFRQLLEQTLHDSPATMLCASAGTCHEALTIFPTMEPDVILLDLNLPDGFGFDVGVQMRQELPSVSIVVLSEHVKPQVLRALPESERPYWSYLLKTGISSREQLLQAVLLTRKGSIVDRTVRESEATATDVRMELLSERQREILSLVAEGLSNSAIAQRLYMSAKSVEYHLHQIYQQLEIATDAGANARVQAALRFSDGRRES